MLRTSNSFPRSDSGVLIDSEPHLSRTCKAIIIFAQLTVLVLTGYSAFTFYTPTKQLIRLHIKYKKIGSEYDQKILQSQTADKPVAS